ncbi:globin [Phenylobacterium sp. VNQ135]|uniref:globin n=1 Tax=Phenylobacterium sp. VNQ135 TaxID=3400922 RepID=UPI003C127116
MAERVGDPAPQIYARLFAAFPEVEPLFWRDANGSIRGEMLAVAIQCLLDLDGAYAENFIRAERVSHEGFDVPPEAFGRFFPVVMETCREILADGWTAETQAAWDERLRRIDALIAKGA